VHAPRETAQPSIADLEEGEKAVVLSALGGAGVKRRLAEMGLTPGTELKVRRKCAFHGPVEIEVRGVCLGLGYGLARKIFVQPLKEKTDD
jgi:Fe2+ transport system protein FeoA